jgi:hypothetical protein
MHSEIFTAKFSYLPVSTPALAQAADDISLYPNPTSGHFTVRSSAIIDRVSVHDLLGRELYTHLCGSRVVDADISSLPPGVYFLSVNNNCMKKIVKQ